MTSFYQGAFTIKNLTVPVIVASVLCILRLWMLIVRYRGIKRLLKWQKILLQQGGKQNVQLSTPERTFQSFMSNLFPDVLKTDFNFTLNFRSKLRQYHPFMGFSLDSAEGIRLTMLFWGQILFVYAFGILLIDALFHQHSSYINCQNRSTQELCEWVDPHGGIHEWMTLCEWKNKTETCQHSFYINIHNRVQVEQAIIIVVILSLFVTTCSIVCTQFILQHPIRCISIAYHIDFEAATEKSLDVINNEQSKATVRRNGTYFQAATTDFNDELRGACGDKRPPPPVVAPHRRRLLKLTQENTLLPLNLGDARRRIFLLAARHRQLHEKYDDLPTGKLLTSLMLCPPTVTPFPQRPMTQVSDTNHCWNSVRTNGEVLLLRNYLQQSAFNPRALQALFETCRHFYTETIYRKLRNAQDITQDLHYLCQHLPAPYSPEAKMLSITSSLVKQHAFDRDLYLMKTFMIFWMPGLQSSLLFQTILEEETEMLYYMDDALRGTLAFEKIWQLWVLRPLLYLYRTILRPDNDVITKKEALRSAFRTTRILYTMILLSFFLVFLPGGIFYYFFWMTETRSEVHPQQMDKQEVQASVLFLWQCVCVVSLVQYYFVIMPLRIYLLDINLPRVWLMKGFQELHRVINARLPYITRRRNMLILDVISPNHPRFLPNQGPIRETGSYLQAFHPVCRVCRHAEILQHFPIAHFFLALSDRDLSMPSHYRPVLEIMDQKQQKNAPKHVELKRLENSTTKVEDALTRQSVLVSDFLTMLYRDIKATLTFLWDYFWFLSVTLFEISLQKLLLLCSERQVRTCVFDLFLCFAIFGYLQWTPLVYMLRYPHIWYLGIVWVYAPVWCFVMFGFIIPKIYHAFMVFWNQGYEDMLTAQERARQRHRLQLRKAHEKESRMVGIDLLGDMPDEVDITEAEAAEEEYLRDKAKRLGKPLSEVRKKPKAFVFAKPKIKYVNKGEQAKVEKAMKWHRSWEHSHINVFLGLVGLNVFWFMPFAYYRYKNTIKASKIAVSPVPPTNDIARVHLGGERDEEEGGSENGGEHKHAEAGKRRKMLDEKAERLGSSAVHHDQPDYGDFSDMDDDSMA